MQTIKAFECTHFSIQQDVPFQMWDSLTSFGGSGLPIWFIRLLHNKPRYYLTNYIRCYFHYLSPDFLMGQLGPLKLIFLLMLVFFIYSRVARIRPVIIGAILLYPFIFIF